MLPLKISSEFIKHVFRSRKVLVTEQDLQAEIIEFFMVGRVCRRSPALDKNALIGPKKDRPAVTSSCER